MRPIDLTLAPRTDPTSIYRSRDGLYADDLLITALVHLDLFSWIAGRGPDGATEFGNREIVPTCPAAD